MDPYCLCLDDYLDGVMSADAATRFDSHLTGCGECREAVAQQRWIEAVLRDEAAVTSAPEVLLAAAAHEISRERHRRRLRCVLAGGLVAAASVALIAWSWRTPMAAPGSTGGSNDQAIVERTATPRQSRGLEEREPAAATFVAGGYGVAVTLESDSPEVTIVQFYPTTEADRRSRRLRELESKYRELIGG